jgi:glycosyltransferase involved in cell wall biosynthesis
MTPRDTLLVIPTYRDSTRLAGFLPKLCAEFARGAGGVSVQVVDDGSSAGEQMWLTNEIDRLRREHPFLQPLLIHSRNRGKGHALRTGWAVSGQMRWLAFVDADGAVPVEEVVALLALARNSAQPALFIAARTDQPGKMVTRFWYRRFGSRVFNRWVRLCLGLECPDTQCGLKVFPAPFLRESGWHEDGFAFDLELLLRARAVGLPVITQPIAWNERSGSSLGPGAMLALFAAVWRLRRVEKAKAR